MISFAAQRLMEMEVGALIGALAPSRRLSVAVPASLFPTAAGRAFINSQVELRQDLSRFHFANPTRGPLPLFRQTKSICFAVFLRARCGMERPALSYAESEPGTTIEQVNIRLLKAPLAEPYKLSFAVVEAFDTLLAEIVLGNGARGTGEATILTGYTAETRDQCWNAARDIASRLPGLATGRARQLLAAWLDGAPFTVTAFATAIEMALGHPALSPPVSPVPILGVLNATVIDELAPGVERLLASGYSTIKVKVGWDADADLARVAEVQRLAAGRARIRIDANQGYSAADACRFVSRLDPQGVELFEQGCAAGDWDAAVAVKRASTVPVMLDESIYAMRDVETAAKLGAADLIKLKLMKLGSLDALERALVRIAGLGMGAVLGNGVATEIGCWMEACVAARMLDGASEMNGFLKQRRSLLRQEMPVKDGCIVLGDGFVPEFDAERLEAVTVASQNF
jgi:L-alanine-DL-glutamate epimerase-like enolase superfamily enzyme